MEGILNFIHRFCITWHTRLMAKILPLWNSHLFYFLEKIMVDFKVNNLIWVIYQKECT
jgi:hypothetical protein